MALSTFIPLKTPIRMLSQTPLKALIRGLLSSVWWWLNGLWLLIWQANQRLARNVTYFFFREIWKDKCPKCLVKLSQLNNFRKEHVNPISNQLTHHLDRMRVKVLWSIPNTISNECGLTFKKKKSMVVKSPWCSNICWLFTKLNIAERRIFLLLYSFENNNQFGSSLWKK